MNDNSRKSGAEELLATSGIKRRGFASMSQEQRSEIARRGGQAAHKCGRAHRFSAVEAQSAGRKGGKLIGQNSSHMSRIGAIGGSSRWGSTKPQRGQPAALEPAAELAAQSPSGEL